MDMVYYIVGKLVINGALALIAFAAIVFTTLALWHTYFQFLWYKYKHLIPLWWKDEKWWEWSQKALADEHTRKSRHLEDLTLTRKKNFAILFDPHHPFGTRHQLLYIRKEK